MASSVWSFPNPVNEKAARTVAAGVALLTAGVSHGQTVDWGEGVTSALGVGLMALVFHSDRSGQDERAGGGGLNSDR